MPCSLHISLMQLTRWKQCRSCKNSWLTGFLVTSRSQPSSLRLWWASSNCTLPSRKPVRWPNKSSASMKRSKRSRKSAIWAFLSSSLTSNHPKSLMTSIWPSTKSLTPSIMQLTLRQLAISRMLPYSTSQRSTPSSESSIKTISIEELAWQTLVQSCWMMETTRAHRATFKNQYSISSMLRRVPLTLSWRCGKEKQATTDSSSNAGTFRKGWQFLTTLRRNTLTDNFSWTTILNQNFETQHQSSWFM